MTTPTTKQMFQSEQEREKVLARIRKTLAIANGTSFKEEADTAMALALDYMKRYGLSMTDVELREKLDETPTEADLPREVKSVETWEVHIAVAISEVFDCKAFLADRYTPQRGRYRTVMFVGFKDDIDMCILVHKIMIVSARAAANAQFKGDGQRIRSFLLGFGVGLRARVREEKEAMQQPPDTAPTDTKPGYALVCVEKGNKIQEYVKSKFGPMRNTQSRNTNPDPHAYMAGRAHSKKVDLMNREKIQ
jgi:hypothetical protein